ncbi:MAG: hypothetical protein ABI864_01425 [Chloroflexota bacterium]
MTSRIRILGIAPVIGGLLFVSAGAFTFVKTQEGNASLKAFSEKQNVNLAYDEKGQLGGENPEEAATAANGDVIPAGSYDFKVDGRYYADFDRANPIEGTARGQAWSATALGLIGELGDGTTTAPVLQLARAMAGVLAKIGLAVIFTGLRPVWVSAARLPVLTESFSTAQSDRLRPAASSRGQLNLPGRQPRPQPDGHPAKGGRSGCLRISTHPRNGPSPRSRGPAILVTACNPTIGRVVSMSKDAEQEKTAPEALKQWRAAERTVAVARRGQLAAQAATATAQEAADAAITTAEASRAALAASALAETSAAKTASAAKIMVQTSLADVADSKSETAMAEVDEAAAHMEYRDAAERAAGRAERLQDA